MSKRPTGPMVPITDGDIKNLKTIKKIAISYDSMAKRTGYSASAISKWMKGDKFELNWRKSVKKKIAKLARELVKPVVAKQKKPELVMSAPQVPSFANEDDPIRRAYVMARNPNNTADLETAGQVFKAISNLLAHKILEN